MEAPSVGDVIIIPFPYSDLTQSKRRPALVLAEAGRGDFLLCQITSRPYDDIHALSLKDCDFHSGGIRRNSYIRYTKIFTANESLITGVAGHLSHSKFTEVINHLLKILTACLDDDTL